MTLACWGVTHPNPENTERTPQAPQCVNARSTPSAPPPAPGAGYGFSAPAAAESIAARFLPSSAHGPAPRTNAIQESRSKLQGTNVLVTSPVWPASSTSPAETALSQSTTHGTVPTAEMSVTSPASTRLFGNEAGSEWDAPHAAKPESALGNTAGFRTRIQATLLLNAGCTHQRPFIQDDRRTLRKEAPQRNLSPAPVNHTAMRLTGLIRTYPHPRARLTK